MPQRCQAIIDNYGDVVLDKRIVIQILYFNYYVDIYKYFF